MDHENLLIRPAGDLGELNERFQERLGAILAEAQTSPDVATAIKDRKDSEARLKRLGVAREGLGARLGEVHGEIKDIREGLIPDLVAKYSGVGAVDVHAKLRTLALAMAEEHAASDAIAAITERLEPEARAALSEALGYECAALACQLETVAAEREQQTAKLAAQAAEFEGGVIVNTRSGLTGSLRAHVDQLHKDAARHFERQSEVERQIATIRLAKGGKQ